MRTIILAVGALLIPTVFGVAAGESDPKRGAALYRACVSCHSLEPDCT